MKKEPAKKKCVICKKPHNKKRDVCGKECFEALKEKEAKKVAAKNAKSMRHLFGKNFEIIYADPGWEYNDKAAAGERGAGFKYRVMSVDQICRLPVEKITAKDAILFMWVTMPFLMEAGKVMEAWGFEYKTDGFSWFKRNKISLSWFFGMGNYTRANCELCLIGVKGNPKRINAGVSSVIDSPIREHSQKPAEVRDAIIKLMGPLKRIELFARDQSKGWESWGNES